MAVRQAGAPDELVRVTVNLTRAQLDHLEALQRLLQDRSIAPSLRRIVQADLDAKQQRRVAS